jgi:hypothetical protein
MGSYYTVVFHLNDGTVAKEYWVVPVTVAGGGPVTLASVRNQVLPTNVAMQTVSKQYVDNAIVRAQLNLNPEDASPYVMKSGDTMTGPLVLPGDPATPLQAADKNYVDTNVSAVANGLNGKVSLLPSTSQLVAQPAGTQLQVTRENGVVNAAALYSGVTGTTASTLLGGSDCTNGCKVVLDPSYAGTEAVNAQDVPAASRLVDDRNGAESVVTYNPAGKNEQQNANILENLTSVDQVAYAAANPGVTVGGGVLSLHEVAEAGGNNQYPPDLDPTIPYFKSTFQVLSTESESYTEGQHIARSSVTHCYAVGDCLNNSNLLYSMGDFHDPSDEGTHPGDQLIEEEPIVFTGTCAGGCSAGSTNVTVAVSGGGGTQGEGRYLLDTNPAKEFATGSIGRADTSSYPFDEVTMVGTNFPVSTFVQTASAALSQPTNISPGTVTLPIVTSGVPAGYATNTAALPASSGVACVADGRATGTFSYIEMAPYTVVDGSHIQLTLFKVHHAGATIAVGGLCGYGFEQTADTQGGIRQVFPIVGTLSATQVFLGDSGASVVGAVGSDSAYANYSEPIASVERSGNVVTVTLAATFGLDLNGLPLTLSGVSDPSFNGNFAITTTSATTFTYADSGPDASSTGGTAGYATPGFAIYPIAEVRSVFDAATRSVDGVLMLAPNTVDWAANDAVEEPHYFEENTHPDTEIISQTIPRPAGAINTPGKEYYGNVGPGLTGFKISNRADTSSYLGGGGTHFAPDTPYAADGVWRDDFIVTAGEDGVLSVNCNFHGCNRYDSGYTLFSLQSALGRDSETYDPSSSTMGWVLGGQIYTFSPSAFTAPTINVGTLHATTITGLNGGSITSGMVPAAVLPVFGPSGTTHAAGVVPDPGATAGASRFLREDGTWALVGGGSGAPIMNPAGGQNNYAPLASPTFTGSGSIPQFGIGVTPSGYGLQVQGATDSQTAFFSKPTGKTRVVVQAGVSNYPASGGGAYDYLLQVNNYAGSATWGVRGDGLEFGTGYYGIDNSITLQSAALGGTSQTGILTNSYGGFYWSASTSNFFTPDTSLTRTAAGTVAIGTGVRGSSSGTLLAGSVVSVAFTETLTTPASSSAPCTAGQFTDDANYHYVCTATNTWKRVALSSF